MTEQYNLAELEGDIDYVLFSEHGLSMEEYTKFRPIVRDLAQLIITHADAAVARSAAQLKYDIADGLRTEIGNIINTNIPDREKVVDDDPIRNW